MYIFSSALLAAISLMVDATSAYVGPQGIPPGRLSTASSSSLEAEWIVSAKTTSPADQDTSRPSAMLPRSGHVSFIVGKDHYVFGGYAEEETSTTNDGGKEGNSVSRYPINDLWKRRVDGDDIFTPWEQVEQKGDRPEERLVSAVSVLDGRPYLFGGWNPNNREQGNEILDTVHSLDVESNEWRKLPVTFPDGPTSRHVALTLPCNSRALLHNHRCTDFVYVFDAKTENFRKQKTSGTAPSSRGLHASCMLGSFALFFGGADKSGQMSNEVFLLNTFTWEWTKAKFQIDENDPNAASKMPCVRAAPNIVAFNETCAILYGGAKASATGLQPLDDVWALFMNRFSGDGRWELISPSCLKAGPYETDDDSFIPHARNAATLTEIGTRPITIDGETSPVSLVAAPKTKLYSLHGGWAPFRKTFIDDFVLRVSLDEKSVN